MKFLHATILLYIFLFTNSCMHRNITFVKKQDRTSSNQTVEKNKQIQTDQVLSEDFKIETRDEPIIVQEKTTLEEIALNQLNKLLDNETSDYFHSTVQKSKIKSIVSEKHSKATKEGAEYSINPSSSIIIGSILLLIAIALIALSVNKIESAGYEETPDGCLASISGAILLGILAVLVGVGGTLLLVFGIIVGVKNRIKSKKTI